MREIPFSLIQFPLWEFFKSTVRKSNGNRPVEPWQATLCGAVSGAIAAFLTTPLDVAKTRVILADKESMMAKGNIVYALQRIYAEKQIRG